MPRRWRYRKRSWRQWLAARYNRQGADELVAVINPPQAAILAVGAVKDRPIVRNDRLAVAKTMRATLSCDHRVLNGVEGGRFLEALKQILENPVMLLLE